MKTTLQRLVIENFGGLHGLSLSLSPGLNVVAGDNEAGKSTTMAFVHAMLFGGTRKQWERFEPLSHGVWGGELWLSTAQGPLGVKREFGSRRVLVSTFDAAGQAVSHERLGSALGVAEAVYRQFFSFTVDELNDFRHLAEDAGLSEALFASSLQGARNLPRALHHLDERIKDLYGPTARTRRLNQQLQALELARTQREALGDRVQAYQQVLASIEGAETRLNALKTTLSSLEVTQRDLRALKTAAAHLAEVHRVERLLADVADVPPERVMQARRLTELQRLRIERAPALARATELANRLRVSMESLAPRADEAWLRATEEALGGLRDLVPAAQTHLQARENARVRRATAATELQSLLSNFSAPRDPPPTPPTDARRQLESLVQTEDTLVELRASRRARVEQAFNALSLAQQQFASAEQRWHTLAPGSSANGEAVALAERERAEARAALEAQQKRTAVQAELSDVERELAAVPPVGPEAAPVMSMLAGVAAIVGLVALAVTWAVVGPGAALALALVMTTLALAGAAWWQHQRQLLSVAQSQRVAQLERRTQLVAAAERLRAALAGIPVPSLQVSQEQVERLAQRVLELKQALSAFEVARVALETAQQQHMAAEEALQTAQQDWQALLTRTAAVLAFAEVEAMTPHAGLDWLGRYVSAVEGWRAAQAQLESCDVSEARVRAALESVAQLMTQVGEQTSSQLTEAGAVVRQVSEWLAGERDRRVRREAVVAQLNEASARGAEAESARDEVEKEWAALLQRAQVTTAEALQVAGAQAARAEELRAELRSREATFSAQARMTREVLEAELARVGELESALREAAAREELVRTDVGALTRDLGRLEQEARALEAESLVRQTRATEEAARLDAEQTAREFAVVALARQMLVDARARFEAEQQPRLMQLTGELFRKLTAGRYVQTVVGVDHQLTVLDSMRHSFRLEQLSRGARELLLIALRLAMVDEFGAQATALPVLMDDVFVNLDPARLQRVVEAVAESASRQQIVVFSCQPHVVEALKQAGATVASLQVGPQQLTLQPQG